MYGSIVGEWTDGTYYYFVHKDAKWNLADTSKPIFTIGQSEFTNTVQLHYWDTMDVKIDGAVKKVCVVNALTITAKTYPKVDTMKFPTVVDGANYTSSETTQTYKLLGTYTEATYTAEDTVHTIYYSVVG